MTSRTMGIAALVFAGSLAAGCAENGANLSTASVASDKTAMAQPKVDPACVSLANQIDTLRKDGTVEKLEKASTGKTANVQVKRAALAKQAELNRANADFQTRCGPSLPKAQSAQAAPVTGTATAAASAATVAKQAATQAAAPAAAAEAQAAAKP